MKSKKKLPPHITITNDNKYRVRYIESKKFPLAFDKIFNTLEEAIEVNNVYLAKNTLKSNRKIKKMGFCDFCDYYLDWYRSKPKKPADGTIRFKKQYIEILKIVIGNVDISELDEVFITTILDKERKRERRGNGKQQGGTISSKTFRHEYIMLNTLCRKMYSWGFVEEDPMKNLEAPKMEVNQKIVPEYEDRVLIEDEFMRQPIRERCQFLLALFAGLREEEVAGLHVDRDIEINTLTIHVNTVIVQNENGKYVETCPKSKSSIRDIPIPQRFVPVFVKYLNYRKNLIEIIKSSNPDYQEIPNLFLNKEGDFYRPNRIGRNYSKLVKKSDVNLPKTFHLIRHYYITNQVNYNEKLNLRDVQEIVGHSDLRTTQGYIHSSKKKIQNHATNIFERFNKDFIYKNGKNVLTLPIEHILSIIVGKSDFSNINDLKITLEEISKENVDFFNISTIIDKSREYLEKMMPALTRLEKYKYSKLSNEEILNSVKAQFGLEMQFEIENESVRK